MTTEFEIEMLEKAFQQRQKDAAAEKAAARHQFHSKLKYANS